MNLQKILLIILVNVHLIKTNHVKLKTKWLNQLLTRTKRTLPSIYSMSYKNNERPCPTKCNCNYDTINCNDLIESCDECVEWSQIDFNQIEYMLVKCKFIEE